MTHAPSEIGMLRLAAHGVLEHAQRTPTGVVQHLGAVQAQMYAGALTSVALRSTPGTRESVVAALNQGKIIKTWPMRGTIHLIPAADLPWMIELTATRMLSKYAKRRRELGLDETVILRAETSIRSALEEKGQLKREEILAVWQEELGLSTEYGHAYHTLSYLHHTGVLCHGPELNGVQHIVLADAWVPQPRRLSREEGLRELARRFFLSHGPATVHDFARWTSLTMTDARTGLASVIDEMQSFTQGGAEYVMDPAVPAILEKNRESAEEVQLLPGFDEFVLGYKDRTDVIADEFAKRIVPGGNGMFRNTIVRAGRIIGTWKAAGSGRTRRIDPEFFEEERVTAMLRTGVEEKFKQLPVAQ